MRILERDDSLNLGMLIFRSPSRSHLKHAERNIGNSTGTPMLVERVFKNKMKGEGFYI